MDEAKIYNKNLKKLRGNVLWLAKKISQELVPECFYGKI
jgi:hypothetical protein